MKLEDGRRITRFIDPDWPTSDDEERGMKYLEDIAMINVFKRHYQ